jgi:rhodanese-related sulfurtransferase
MSPFTVPTLSASDVADDAFLLDVREREEWTAGHVAGSRHLPMSELPARVHEVPADRDVVVVCRSGARSARVVQFLRHQGGDRVHNLGGGLIDWVSAGRSLVTDDGAPPRVR